MQRILLGLFILTLSAASLAAGPAAVRKRVQLSMVVTGAIVVSPEGGVRQFTLDHPEQLPQAVVNLVDQAIPAWRFEPVTVAGRPATAKSAMSLRIVAAPLDGGKNYRLQVAGASFNHGEDASGRTITENHIPPPPFPLVAADAGVQGTVYVLAKVGRDGKVIDAIARQVNLQVVASDSHMAAWQRALAQAALGAARRWTFHPPTVGSSAAQPHWYVQIPVVFTLDGSRVAKSGHTYGAWQAYVPGPVNEAPWGDRPGLAGSGDAMPDHGIFLANDSLHLLTALGAP